MFSFESIYFGKTLKMGAFEEKYIFFDGLLIRCCLIEGTLQPIDLVSLNHVTKQLNAFLEADSRFEKKHHHHSRRKKRSSTTIDENLPTDFFTTLCRPRFHSETVHQKSDTTDKMSDLIHTQPDTESDVFNQQPVVIHSKPDIDTRINDIIRCLHDTSADFVHVTTFRRQHELTTFLCKMKESHVTALVDLDLNPCKEFMVQYYLLSEFYQDHMVLKGRGDQFLMFMPPF